MKDRIPVLLLAIVLAGCEAPGPPRQTVLPPKAGGDQPAENMQRLLLTADYDFARTSEEKGAAEAFYEYMAPEGTLLAEDELPIKGRDAIKVFRAAAPQGWLTWKPRAAEIGAGAEIGYTWGTYEFRENSPDGKAQVHYGKYVHVWKKQPDGSWKVAVSISNSSPPPGDRR